MKKYLVVFIFALLILLLLYKQAFALSYSDYESVFGTLVNASSILFTVMGIWIAIIYPEAMKNNFRKKNENNLHSIRAKVDQETNNVSELIELALISAVVLMGIILMQFAYPLLRELEFLKQVEFFKLATFFVSSFLTGLQLLALAKVVLANYYFLNKVRSKNISDEIDDLHK